MFRPWEPETVARHAAARRAARIERVQKARARLVEIIVEKWKRGPEEAGIWIEMLADHDAQHPEEVTA